MIEVNILADSINFCNDRLTTFLLKYPRMLHSEFLTHRVFSRNTSSSRAIPTSKMIEMVITEPVEPMMWGKNQKGMQSFYEVDEETKSELRREWNELREITVERVGRMAKLGLHKQYVNRALETFSHITVICTSTDFDNFFLLRNHPDAMPEIAELAKRMESLYDAATPTFKAEGQWHLPFGDKYTGAHPIEELVKICTARCARTSYLNFDGDISAIKDFQLHDDLAKNGHWSPFEHSAQALSTSKRSGNFQGWFQYRKMFQQENRKRAKK